MFKKFTFFCFITLFSILPKLSEASHIAGGDLSYVCLGGNNYQINLNLFVDCLGFDPGATQTVTFTSSCGGSVTTSVNVTNPGGTEISQLCPSSIDNSTCHPGGTLPGMWVFHFTGTVNLSPPCDTWTASWSTCCRNSAILNLDAASSASSYIEATINSVTAPCNSSPAFTAQPIPYVCANQLVNYSYGVVETDGDSLVYSLIDAMTTSGAPLTYSVGYSATSPIPGIVIDPATGMLTFTPTTLGNFVVVVLVEEYDNAGNLIGTVMRDIQFVVQSCSNLVPDPSGGAITSLTGTAVQTGPFSIEMCEGSVFTFTATYNDDNATDSLTLITNLLTILPGATITVTGGNPAVATISWTAPAGTANTNTTFSITINDGACPVPGQQTFVYDVQVQPRTLAGPDVIICGPQTAALSVSGGSTFNWVAISGPAIIVGVNFSCDTCIEPTASPIATTTYEVTSNLSGTCINKDTVTVTVVPDFTFTTTQSTATLCTDQSVQFTITGSPAGAYTYLWSPGATLDNTTIYNPTALLSTAGTYNYYVNITSPQGCVKRDTLTAVVLPSIRTITVPDTTLCGTQSANLSATGGTSFTWSVLSGPPIVLGTNFSCINCANPVATPVSTTTYIVTSDLSGTCVNKDTVTVNIVANFSYTVTQSSATSCLLDPVQLDVTGISPVGAYSFVWSPATNLSNDTIPNPTATFTSPGTYNYTLTVTSPLGCVQTNSLSVVAAPAFLPEIIPANDTAFCAGGTIDLEVHFAGSSAPPTCGLSPSGGCGGTSLAGIVGTGTTTNTATTWPAIFGNWYTSEKHQMLFRASELIAAGVTGGKIDQLDFKVDLISGITTYHQFTIRMGCTSLNALGSTWESGLTQVYNPHTVNVVVGWNTMVFDNAFQWDGISNIIVEVCSSEGPGAFGYSNYTQSCSSPFTTTAFTSCLYSYTDANDMCPDLINWITPTNNRPNVQFHYCSMIADPADFTYEWTPSSGGIADATAQNTTGVPPSTMDYYVKVTSTSGGCFVIDTIHVDVTSIAALTVSPAGPYCPESNIDTLQVSVPTGVGIWTGAGITDSILGVFSPLLAGPGIHEIIYTLNTCGTASDTIYITVTAPLDPSIIAVSPFCVADPSVNLTSVTPGGVWSGLGITDATLGTFDPGVAGVGTHTIMYVLYSCYAIGTTTITLTPILNPAISAVLPMCTSSPVDTLTAVDPGGTWSGPGIIDAVNGLFDPSVSGSGTHIIYYTIPGSCGAIGNQTIVVQAAPTVTSSEPLNREGCEPSTFLFGAIADIPGGTCLWYFGDDSTSNVCNPQNTYDTAGVYNVTFIYQTPLGCRDTIYDVITIHSQPEAAYIADPQPTTVLEPEIHFTDQSTGLIDTWHWTFGYSIDSSIVQNPTYIYPDSGTYPVQLIVTNIHTCADTVDGFIRIDQILVFYAPNAFTPNDNGNNDVFRVYGDGIDKSTFEMTIYNRWGELILKTKDYEGGWNGAKNNTGELVQQDVYIWKVKFKDYEGKNRNYVGHVTIVK